MHVIWVGRVPAQHLHRIFDAFAGATNEVRVVLLAHAGGFGLVEYSETPETLEHRPEVHRRPRRFDDFGFGFDDTHADPGLCETERIDEAHRPATDDYHVFHWEPTASNVARRLLRRETTSSHISCP